MALDGLSCFKQKKKKNFVRNCYILQEDTCYQLNEPDYCYVHINCLK